MSEGTGGPAWTEWGGEVPKSGHKHQLSPLLPTAWQGLWI